MKRNAVKYFMSAYIGCHTNQAGEDGLVSVINMEVRMYSLI